MTLFQFAFIRSMRRKSLLASMFIIPLAMLVMKPLWMGEDPAGFALYSMVLMFIGFSLVSALLAERANKTIVRIFAAPVTTFQYLMQNMLAFWLMIGAQIVVVVVVLALLYRWTAIMAAGLILCYGVFAITCIAFSLAWNTLFRSKVMSDAVFSVVLSFMALLGGIFIPLSLLPDFLRSIGMLFPTYWISHALLSLLQQQVAGYWLSVIVLLLFAIVFLLFGSKRRME